MAIPTLTTARLTLRPFTLRDGNALHHILQQKQVLRYFPRPDPPPRERVQQFIRDQLRRWRRDGFGLWAVELRDRPGLIGWVGLQNLAPIPRTPGAVAETNEVEVGYLLNPAYWGQGLATEGALASLHYGFETLKLPRIVAIVHPENAASQRVAQKLGMHCDGEAVYWGMPALHYVIEAAPNDARTNDNPCHAERK